MPTLIILRHGQSAWNLENRFTGEADVDLTPAGEDEARHAGVLLKPYPIELAYTSVLKRAIRTLDLVLTQIPNRNMPIIKSSALNERNYGELQGLNKTEMEKKYGADQVLIWRRSYDVIPPGGESLKDTYDRVVPYYKAEIEVKLRAGRHCLIVAHGNSLRALMMYLENISPENIAEVNIATGAPKIYEFDQAMKLEETHYLP